MFRVVPYKANKCLNRLTVLYRSASAAPTAHHGEHHAYKFDQAEAYPQIGKREIVGYGYNGRPQYFDHGDTPCPSVRWREDTPEILALKTKEKGEWKNLSVKEKKELYRASFRSTIAEVEAPTGEGKYVLGFVLGLMGFSLILYEVVMRKFIYNFPRTETNTPEYQGKVLEKMIAQTQGRVHGVASNWDYEKGDWKWNTGKK